jgi:inner membrane protein
MASVFTHAIVAAGFGRMLSTRREAWSLYGVMAILAILPDADVLAFRLDIPYEAPFGHRGFSHSIAFALVLAVATAALYRRAVPETRYSNATVAFLFFIATASHGVLDAMTNGGLGVAFAWPFTDTRYFLPFRPIVVSSLDPGRFFSEWGVRVLVSELRYVVAPMLILGGATQIVLRWREARKR